MLRPCTECGGLGYIEYADYDYEENITDFGIRVTCDLCQGEGFYKARSVPFLITIHTKPMQKVVLDIEDTVDRPNNPEIQDIVDTYVKYNYGEVNYNYNEIDDIAEIPLEWNIENYK